MNAYKSVLSFCLLLVAINCGNSLYTPLNEKTLCEGSTLIQYTNYFECLCAGKQVHVSDTECKLPVEKCTKQDEVCGNYAKCHAEADAVTFTCKCDTGYESIAEKPLVCIPKGCPALAKNCVGGTCIKKDDFSAQCGCNIGKKPGDKNDCVDATPNAECKLTCLEENTGCVIIDKTHYDCGCKEGFEFFEGKCVEKNTENGGEEDKEEEDEKEDDDSGSAFPASGILNVGLLFIVSSIVYVLV